MFDVLLDYNTSRDLLTDVFIRSFVAVFTSKTQYG